MNVITELNISQKSIIRMLLYFDVFQYPLTREELSICVADENELKICLDEMKESGLLSELNGFYFLSGRQYTKRIIEQSLSPVFIPKAVRYGKLISKFPFVRGVYVSGSLSKDWADADTDVDFFIITTPNRLWLCRTLLILFKKAVLLNSRKYFCLNYFIDTESLEIEEKNIFTATEIAFMKPVVHGELFSQFLNENGWVKRYFNKVHLPSHYPVVPYKTRWAKSAIEWLLNGKLGERLDIASMRKTLNYWKKKFPEMANKDFEINFKTKRSISKHHPGGFQKRVLAELQSNIDEFERKHRISLS